jgi:hypothetical protein
MGHLRVIFIVPSTLFRDDLEGLPELLSVVRLAFHGRHRVLVEPSWRAEPSPHPLHAWLRGRAAIEARWIREAFDAALRSSPPPERVAVRLAAGATSSWARPTPTLTVADACSLAHAPLHLLLEDFEDDASLLFWAGRALENPSWARIEKARRHGWQEVEHGGGNGSMRRRVDALDASRALRTWVMFDHDGLQPGDDNRSPQAKRLAESCARRGIEPRWLARRSIENYLPPELLDRWAKDHFKGEDDGRFTSEEKLARRRALVDAFQRLTADQRRHYYLREGLRKDANREVGLPSVFSMIPWEDQAALACGFDEYDREGVSRLFGHPRAQVKAGVLKDDGSAGELRTILDSIVARL